MTVLEALKETRNNLGAIPVKVKDMNVIGLPIHTAVQNLGAIITALENAPQQPEQPTPAQEGDNNGKDADN